MSKTTSILFVDDDPNMRRMVELFLKNQDVLLECAGNGRAALKYTETQNFDLIFTDVQMPEMDGLSLLSELKKRNVSTPVVIVSAFGQESASRQAFDLGAGDVINKPFDRNTILKIISKHRPK